MMGGRTWDEWIDEYSESHQHPINQLTHKFGIPMIALSLLLVPVSFFIAGAWRVALACLQRGGYCNLSAIISRANHPSL